jgi:hypothetical protein
MSFGGKGGECELSVGECGSKGGFEYHTGVLFFSATTVGVKMLKLSIQLSRKIAKAAC